MKWIGAWAAAFLLVAGCSETVPTSEANLLGTYQLALYPKFLFVTSSDSNEVRVLRLSDRQFERAPNPLEPLSIPVVEHPTLMARDLYYKDGVEGAGHYLYVGSGTSKAISVIGADESLLKTLARIEAGASVTAMAAQGSESTDVDSVLYFATWDGQSAQIHALTIPAIGKGPLSPTLTLPPPRQSIPGELVTAMAVMPDGKLALASKNIQTSEGSAAILDMGPPTPVSAPVEFSYPVRMLLTHATAGDWPAGTRLFGVVDEEACELLRSRPGGKPELNCSPGIVQVESATGLPPTGTAGEKLPVGAGLTMGFTVVPGRSVSVPNAAGVAVRAFELLGLATSSDGKVLFFDAKNWALLDGNGQPPSVGTITASGKDLTATPGPGLLTAQVSEGVTQDEVVKVINGAATPAGPYTVLEYPPLALPVTLGQTAPKQDFLGGLSPGLPHEGGPPSIKLVLGAEDPQFVTGATYEVPIFSNFNPLYFAPDAPRCGTLVSNLNLPGAVVHLANEATAFVVYPSSNALVEFFPTEMVPNQPTQNIKCYR
jgi:hypothetical protein